MTLVTEPLAIFSRDRRYRYTLRRQISMVGKGVCVFVMCNPSTASEYLNDPTVRRCIGFALSWGYAHLVVVNLFALRSTDPSALVRSNDPIGPMNDGHIWGAVHEADLAVFAWGNFGATNGRSKTVLGRLMPYFGDKIRHLGLTNEGEPAHPLYLPKVSQLQEFRHAA